jgi:hypothetical protein
MTVATATWLVAARLSGGTPGAAGGLASASVQQEGGDRAPYFAFFARPLVLRAAPRPRAALPLAPAERLPVSFEKASMTLPAILSTVPSALSRDPDFITSRPFAFTTQRPAD